MKVNPQIRADLEENPELRKLYETAIISVVKLMQLHDIVDLRRIRKSGVFGRRYDKDVVVPLGLPNVPQTVASTRSAAGRALLDYLETVGITGLSIDVEKGDADQLMKVWEVSEKSQPAKTSGGQPKAQAKKPQPRPPVKPAPQPKPEHRDTPAEQQQPAKEVSNGQAKN